MNSESCIWTQILWFQSLCPFVSHGFTLQSLAVYFNLIPLFNRDSRERGLVWGAWLLMRPRRPRGDFVPRVSSWTWGALTTGRSYAHPPALLTHCERGGFRIGHLSHALTLGESPILSVPSCLIFKMGWLLLLHQVSTQMSLPWRGFPCLIILK